MTTLIDRLKNPELHYPGNFDTPARANAVLMSLCQEASDVLADIKQDLTTVQNPVDHLLAEITKLWGVIYIQQQQLTAPAVPDAFGTREGEHPQYIQGWNDCRAEMLREFKEKQA